MKVLIAGLGNIFQGDDAFGVEVIRRLAGRALPSGVEAVDFGIKAIDLSYALLDRYDAALLLDTFQNGGAPGTLYVVEPQRPADVDEAAAGVSPHELDPPRVLQAVWAMDGRCRRVLLLGCEPGDCGGAAGAMGLSAAVAAAVERAADKALALARGLLNEGPDSIPRRPPQGAPARNLKEEL